MSKEYLVYQALSVNNNQDKLMKYLVELERFKALKTKKEIPFKDLKRKT